MDTQTFTSKKGVTLIELLVALVICGMIIAGIYRVFIAQTRAYTVQDQVVEVQQSVRGAMELLLRDLRMSSYDSDENPPVVGVPDPAIVPGFNGNDSISIFYQYDDALLGQIVRRVNYWRDGNGNLNREQFANGVSEGNFVLLENVDAFTLTYGVDGTEGMTETQDGSIDDISVPNGILDINDFVNAAAVGTQKVIAVRMVLSARPAQDNPDVRMMVSPRTLTSIVTLRNRCLIKEDS